MEKIKFNKNDIIFNVRMTRVKNDVIKIESEKAIPNEIITNGFAIINEFNDSIMADYSDYKTIYVESTELNMLNLHLKIQNQQNLSLKHWKTLKQIKFLN